MTDFNQVAASWDENPERRKRSEEVAQAILAHTSITKSTVLLEFGCGSGVISLYLCPHLHAVIAADTAEEMLSVVHKKAAESLHINIETLHLKGVPGEYLPPCDLIASSMTLHHIEDLPELFGRFHQALPPGGMVALADLDAEGGLFHPDPAGVFHNGFEHAELEGWLRAAGFSKIRFHQASQMRKLAADGVERAFSIFLVVAEK